MKANNNYMYYHQSGFTLVEIMVGMAIGLIVTLVIVQAMSVFEGQRRSTTGTADAQTNGSISLYNIGRELQYAGYGLMPAGVAGTADSPLECATVTPTASATAAGIVNVSSISPVSITDGVSDTITIHYGDSLSGGIPSPIISSPIGKAITVGSNFGCNNNDLVFITNGSTCAATKLAAAGVSGTVTVNINSADAVPAAAVIGANLSCLGNWNTATYAVSAAGNLTRKLNAGATTDSVAGVVNIQAQYGISSSASSNQVTQWVEPSAVGWTNPTVANRNLIKAIRIAIVARNARIEPNAITLACSSRVLPGPTGLCAWEGTATSPAPTIDLSADPNWDRYHYRVYTTIIPLRNMIWSKDTL